jgi:8-oxo-dGTP pyrophosphatase MutT (NUDIX family)
MTIEAFDRSVHYPQSGVVPFRIINSDIQILLITTNSRKHWTIPKGLIEDGMSSAESAVQEAYEEAGIRGDLYENSIGNYRYQKWGGTCEVEVFLMAVTLTLTHWPEEIFRERLWCNTKDVGAMVKHDGLQDVFSRISRVIQSLSDPTNPRTKLK